MKYKFCNIRINVTTVNMTSHLPQSGFLTPRGYATGGDILALQITLQTEYQNVEHNAVNRVSV